MMYEAYVKEWYGYARTGPHAAASQEELIAARKRLMDQVNELAEHIVESSKGETFDQMLDANLYQDNPEPAECSQLLKPDEYNCKEAGEGFNVNRCTLYGLNTILGAPYFTNLRQFFKVLAASEHTTDKILQADFCQRNLIPIPTGAPFATVQINSRLQNVTMVPRAQFNGAEIDNFCQEDILLDIALALCSGSTRVACVTTGAIHPSKEIGTQSHFTVFQYSVDIGRWVYMNPPGHTAPMSSTLLKNEGFSTNSELKIYSLVSVGPIPPKDKPGSKSFSCY